MRVRKRRFLVLDMLRESADRAGATGIARGVLVMLCGIDLRALQAVRIIDVQRFPFRVKVDGGGSRLAMAVARALRAAKGKLDFSADRGRIDVDNSGF